MNLNLNSNQTTKPAKSEEDYVPSEFWANIGYWDEIDGERVFVSISKGVPLDTLKATRGTSELTVRKNRLNRMVLEACQTLEPGQAEDVLELTVQLRRISAEAEEPKTGMVTTLTGLSFASKKAA